MEKRKTNYITNHKITVLYRQIYNKNGEKMKNKYRQNQILKNRILNRYIDYS